MSAVVKSDMPAPQARQWPLLKDANRDRVIAWRDGRCVHVAEFVAHIQQVAKLLPASGSAINLCEDRYSFIVGFCASASLGHTTLLPPSRASQAVAETCSNHSDSYVLGDAFTCEVSAEMIRLPALDGEQEPTDRAIPVLSGDLTVAIGFTSGSTSLPKANTKSWDCFRLGSASNICALTSAIGLIPGELAHVVATVPAQHMYGMEMSVLLPLFGPFAVHSGKPFFPADIAKALAELPEPRLLVTTPVHLRALLRDQIKLPALAAIISATAPLSEEIAAQAEASFGAPLIELFGSTETCVIAHRRTAIESDWRMYANVEMSPQPDGTLVRADHLSAPVLLQDLVEMLPGRRFRLCGRNADLLEIAGKRASLADLTRRLHALHGVLDAVVFQLDGETGTSVQRIAALVVAPSRSERELLGELRQAIDPVFLPRPLRIVTELPRNETGKLPRHALLALLDGISG